MILGLKNLILYFARMVFGKHGEDVRVRATAHLVNNRTLGTHLNAASPAWGRQAHATPANLARTHPARPNSSTPWGWPGNDHDSHEHASRPSVARGSNLNAYLARKYEKQQSVADWKRNVGRPLRDDSSPLSGQVYRPSQDAISKYGMDKKDDKPWGW